MRLVSDSSWLVISLREPPDFALLDPNTAGRRRTKDGDDDDD